jgi:hypothetical protein
MAWPDATDYNEAVQNPAVCFADPDLREGRPEVNALGWPLPCSGNFAAVYKVYGPDGTAWAVKCFTRAVPGLRERYHAISSHLREARLPFAVDFQYLEEGIRIRGDWYAVLKMRWVEGFTLNAFLKDHADRPQILERLAGLWLKLAGELRRAGIAHADLQHGNVLLVPGGKSGVLSVRLIDYDGMFVPALARRGSGEVGHANYQHPERARLGTYDAEVDRFAHLVIYTALQALQVRGRALWERYDNGENLLFREQDFLDPAGSALFRELSQMSDPGVRGLAAELARACQGHMAEVPLLAEVVKADRPPSSGDVSAEPRSLEPAWWATAPPPVRGDRPNPPEEPRSESVSNRLRKAALVLGCVALVLSFVPAIAALSIALGGLGLLLGVGTGFAAVYQGGKGLGIALAAAMVNCLAFCVAVSWIGRPNDLLQVAKERREPGRFVSRPVPQLPGDAGEEQTAPAPPREQAPIREVVPAPEVVPDMEEWLALQARMNIAAEEMRRTAEERRAREQKEAARRTLEAALQRQKEEALRKAQQATLQRKQEEAARAAQAAALRSQKAEKDAARKLDLARIFIKDSLEKERTNEPEYARRLMAIAHKRLHEIIRLYPGTRAAAECRKLLKETAGEL